MAREEGGGRRTEIEDVLLRCGACAIFGGGTQTRRDSPPRVELSAQQLASMDYASTLPREVLVMIFSGLVPPNPHSVRDLCAAASVCPSWREAAKEPGLWRVLVVGEAPLNERLTGRRLRNLVARSHNTLSRLALEGCPLVNETALALSLQQQPHLVFVSVKDCALVTRPSLAHALCDSEDFQEIVEQLNDPRQSAADAQRCCVALQMLLCPEEEDEDEVDFDEAVEVADALLRCAALHATHAGVQAACCYAFSRYFYSALGGEIASDPLIFQAAVAALKAHPLDVEVQKAALFALRSVCSYGLEGTPGVPALLDAILPVLAALRAFPTGLDVQDFGCDSLTNMCKLDASVAEAVAVAGGMSLFIKALRLDTADDAECMSAMSAIRAIALSKAALPQAAAGIDTVVRTLRRHESGALAAAACKTLGTYLLFSATRELAMHMSADFAVRATAAKHSTDATVQQAAALALWE